MKNLLKRTFCLMLALVLCFGMIPTVATAEETSVEISFASTDQRTEYNTSKQVWANADVTLTNNKSASTTSVGDYSNPARFYASSNLVIEAPGNITQIVFTASSSSYASALKNSAGDEATVSGSTVTITPTTAATTYTIEKLTAQVRAKSVVVTYEQETGACQHTETTTTTVDATCTTDGSVTVTCNSCGEVISEETIDADHSYTSVVTPPTATEQGYTTYTCSGCGDSYKDNYTEALGESYTVSFEVPEGVTAVASMECDKAGITLPDAEAPAGYTFVGWTDGAVEDTETAPTIYTDSYVATADTTLYALYTHTVAGGGSTEYVLTDISAISATDEVVITMTYTDGTVYALNSGNGTSAAPAATIITVADDKITSDFEDTIKWNVGGDSTGYIFYPNGSDSTWLYCTSTNNGVRVGTNTANTFVVDATSGYLKHTGTGRYVGVYRTNPDWRCYTNTTGNIKDQTLGFYVKSEGGTIYYTTLSTAAACTHENTTDTTVDATCTAAGSVTTTCDDCGMTVGVETNPATGHVNTTTTTTDATCTEAGSAVVTCDDCGATVSTEEIAALGHSIEDGVCTVCGYEVPDYSGDYYIATKRTDDGNYWYMTNDLGTASNKRYQAAEQGATLPESIVGGETDKTFTLILQNDGTYIIKTGDSYLGWSSGNTGILVEEAEALKLTVEMNEGLYNIHFTGDEERYLSLNGTADNDYFAFYKGTQKQDLSLIPVLACTHENTTTTTVDATCTTDGSITVTCSCGEVISIEVIPATGHVDTTTTTVEATCTENGSVTVTCSCGEVISTEVISATGHNYVDGICGCGQKAGAQVGSAYYTTVQEAASAASAGAYMKLLGSSTEIVSIEKDLNLDLNGFDLGGVTVAEGAILYGVDSTTDDYDCSDGYGTIAVVSGDGEVATQYKATVNGNIRRYVTCVEDGVYSFHRIYVGVTSVSLRPGASGMGYKATIAGDEKVLAMMDGQVYMTMWVEGNEANAVTKATDMNGNRMTVSALVKGMDVEKYHSTVLCAKVSVNVNGEEITSSTTEYTLKQAVEAVADAVAGGKTYTDAQMSAIQNLCSRYSELMADWSNIGSILNWTAG